MAKLNGKIYSKIELQKYCPSMDQIASVTKTVCEDGKASDLRLYSVKTGGGLEFQVLPSRCLDIASLSYKGVNISYLTKNSLVGPNHLIPIGTEFFNYMIGGMLFTCGLRNVGGSCIDDDKFHPFHGKIGITPSENTSVNCYWDQDDYVMDVCGTMHETSIFDYNLSLSRKISSKLGGTEIVITDVIENHSNRDEEFMFLYHFNFGFPFIDESTKLIYPKSFLTARNESSQKVIEDCEKITKPVDNIDEYVYFRDVSTEDGFVSVKLENPELKIGVCLKYEKKNLPNLAQWKMMRSGDYVIGIEPCNNFIHGRHDERENGTLLKIPSYSKLEYKLNLSFYDL